jgi:hypothetical protein
MAEKLMNMIMDVRKKFSAKNSFTDFEEINAF